MPTSRESSRIGLLLTSLTVFSIGCIDNMDTILRDKLSAMSEKVDVLMHVVDQPSAKLYMKGVDSWEKRFRNRFEAIEERQRKVEDNMQNESKVVRKLWSDQLKFIEECIKAKKCPKDDEEWDAALPKELKEKMPKFFRYYTREAVACEFALEREKDRLQKVLNELSAGGKECADVKALVDNLSGAKK